MHAVVETKSSSDPSAAWRHAVRLLESWLEGEHRADHLLESLPGDLDRVERARVQALLLGGLRHLGRIEAHLRALARNQPRPAVHAALVLAGFEMIEGGTEGHAARVGHHAVEQVKRSAHAREAAFVNAIVRRLAAAIEAETEPATSAPVADWARYHSHPEWLLERWSQRWGNEGMQELVRWNQQSGEVHVRWRDSEGTPAASEFAWLRAVEGAPGFFAVSPGHWPDVSQLIVAGSVHVQDAATRHAIDLLAPVASETVLDLCAAPGGKSLAIADRMRTGTLVALDRPGRRLVRLRENLARVPSGMRTRAVGGDLLKQGGRALAVANAPAVYDAVLLDAPCSNTGVMRHRVDVKWRLEPDEFRRQALAQLALLQAAAERVGPGGRLVYSTCSIDSEENEQVADAFVRRSRGLWREVDRRLQRAGEHGQDGAAAFRFERG